jgi:hypothetical protein
MSASLPLALGPLYHVGMIVPSVSETAKAFSVAGLEFMVMENQPRRYNFFDGEVHEYEMDFGWCPQEGTSFELMRGVPGTVWELRDEPYIHHLSYKVKDFDEAAAALIADGRKCLATDATESMAAPRRFGYWEIGGDVLLELIDAQFVPE